MDLGSGFASHPFEWFAFYELFFVFYLTPASLEAQRAQSLFIFFSFLLKGQKGKTNSLREGITNFPPQN
jgi:hypothetical protein